MWKAACDDFVRRVFHADIACGNPRECDLRKSFDRRNVHSFESTTANGTRIEFTLDKTGPDKGSIREKRWEKGKDPTKDRPHSKVTAKLYDIKAETDRTKLVAMADVPFKNPMLTFTLDSPAGPKDPRHEAEMPSVTLIVKGTTFGLKDRTTIYPINENDRAALIAFIVNANLPTFDVRP